MRLTLRGARLVDAFGEIESSNVALDGASIRSVGLPLVNGETVVAAEDAIVMPGFIEVHTHGGGGYNLHTTDLAEINGYASWVPSTGVTSFLVTVVGVPDEMPLEQLHTAVQAVEEQRGVPAAEPVGIFMEGPYINVKKRGAHPPIWLRLPNFQETEQLLELSRGHLKLITLAPELPGADEMIRRLVEARVTVSIGHTDANYTQAQEAIALGASHMTHCFNAMHSLHHRTPGPLAAVAQADRVFGEVIADGVHVHPAMLDMLVRMLGVQRVVVITDAQSCAGYTGGDGFEFAGQPARVINGAAYLADGTLTGSILTMEQALRNVLKYTRLTLSEAVGMLSANPARTAQVAERKGRLQAGFDADLLIFDQSLQLQATLCRGEVAFATDAWRERLSIAR